MKPDMLVALLEQNLRDMKNSLGAGQWEELIGGLRRCSEDVTNSVARLSQWADDVVEVMSKTEYTKGLLRGTLSAAEFVSRGSGALHVTSSMPHSGTVGQPPGHSGANEVDLASRIKAVLETAVTQ
jgi:hypothetical protein